MHLPSALTSKPDSLLNRIRQDLRNCVIWTREYVGSEQKEIFHPDDVRQFWTGEYQGKHNTRVEALCKRLFHQDYTVSLEKVRKDMLLILSVLVYCEWTHWDSFKYLVRNPYSSGSTSDQDLPLSEQKIRSAFGLGCDEYLTQYFERHQWAFIPIIIGSPNEYASARFRLPFRAEDIQELGFGASATVMKITIPPRFHQSDDGTFNTKDESFAWKKFEGGKVCLFEAERQVLQKLKASPHRQIMCSVADLQYGTGANLQCGILFPAATCNLRELIFDKKHESTRKKLFEDPNCQRAILQQMCKIAEAIRHLHKFLEDESCGHWMCAHRDLHLRNVVITPQSGSIVGEWKIIDFGLSKLEKKNIPSGSLSSRVQSTFSPGQGLYSAPDVGIGKDAKSLGAGDIYSLGRILATILAFLLEQHDGAVAFNDVKDGDFHLNKNGKYTRNPKVTRWLKDVKYQYGGTYDWVPQVVDLISACIELKQSKRPDANEVVNKLHGVVNKMFVNTGAPDQQPKAINIFQASLSHIAMLTRSKSNFKPRQQPESNVGDSPQSLSPSLRSFASTMTTLTDGFRGFFSP